MPKLSGFFKIILALAIPALLVCAFMYSQREANREVDDYHKFQKAHPPAVNITVDHYELKQVDDSDRMIWQLVAQHGTMQPDTKDVDLKDVVVNYFDQGKLKMSLSAPVGVANESTNLVKLLADDKRLVRADGEDGKAQLHARKVELTKKNQFVATGDVTIVYPGVAKVTGGVMTGSLEKTGELKNFTIVGNTHALLGKF